MPSHGLDNDYAPGSPRIISISLRTLRGDGNILRISTKSEVFVSDTIASRLLPELETFGFWVFKVPSKGDCAMLTRCACGTYEIEQSTAQYQKGDKPMCSAATCQMVRVHDLARREKATRIVGSWDTGFDVVGPQPRRFADV